MFLSSILKNLQGFPSPPNLFQRSCIFPARTFPLLSNLSILNCHAHPVLHFRPTTTKKIILLLLHCFPVHANTSGSTGGSIPLFTAHLAVQHPSFPTSDHTEPVLLPHASLPPMNLKRQKDVKMQASSSSQKTKNWSSHGSPTVLFMTPLFFKVFYAIIM